MCEKSLGGLAVKETTCTYLQERELGTFAVGLWLEELTDLLVEFDLAPVLSSPCNPSKVSGLLPFAPPPFHPILQSTTGKKLNTVRSTP